MKQAVKRIVLPGPGPRRLPIGIGRGVRMRIDFATQTRIYLGLYEAELNQHLRQMLKRGVTSFDVGAQYGYDSLVIAKHTRARVATFECDSDSVAAITANFELNPDLARYLQPIHATVGTEFGLDDWAYGDGFVPDFLKIDIEGAEAEALLSAERILDSRHPALIVEVHSADLERACGEILTRHGYEPSVVSQRRIAADRRPSEHNRWLVAS
jgi:hypothetical protein